MTPTIAELSAKITDLEGKLTAETAKVTDLEGKLSAETAKVTDLEGKLSAETAKDTELEGKLTAETAKVTDLEGKLTAETAKVTDLQGKLTDEIAKVTNAENALATAKQSETAVREFSARHGVQIPAKVTGAQSGTGSNPDHSSLKGLAKTTAYFADRIAQTVTA